jgi:Phage portal protein, SPP1 Gp6-like
VTTRDDRTPEEKIRDRLLGRLRAELPSRSSYVAWYRGDGPVPAPPKKYSRAYAHFRSMSTNAWPRLVVDSLAQRIKMIGVDVGDDDTNLEIWNLLRANRFDSDQRLVTIDSLTTGTSYVSVFPSSVEPAFPRIVPESSLTTVTESAPADRRETVAALKVWYDEVARLWHSTLYLPDEIYKWSSSEPDETKPYATEDDDIVSETSKLPNLPVEDRFAWSARTVDDEAWPAPNVLGVVPIVAVPNRPDVYTPVFGVSEIGDLEPILKRADKLTLDLMLASELASFRQRWATGLDVPKDSEGKPVEPFHVALDRLWVSTSPETAFGDFGATDLGPYLRVPSYYLVSPSLVNPPSAEAMRAAEAGLVAKVRDQATSFGEAYEKVVRLALRIAGVDISEPEALTIEWADPETKSDAQLADAAVKWKEVGVPADEIWRRLGATPRDIVEWRQKAAAETALTALLTPVPSPAPETGAA